MRSINLSRILVLVLGVLLLPVPSGLAWGPNGHRAVGSIAEKNLNDHARTRVKELLGGESLAAVSNWADLIRSFEQWRCADPSHYSSIEPGAEYGDRGVPSEGDGLGAIGFFCRVLANPAESFLRRANALRLLVHIIGDLHQPLHVGLGCDRGRNDVVVKWMGEERRLHSVWDSAILESLQLSYSEYVDLLVESSWAEKSRIQESSPLDWANESQQLLTEVYRCSVQGDRCPCLCGDCENGCSVFGGCSQRPCRLVPAPVTLSFEYKARAEPIISRRVQEAGLRLAAVLNWALSSHVIDQPKTQFSGPVADLPRGYSSRTSRHISFSRAWDLVSPANTTALRLGSMIRHAHRPT